MRVQITTEVHRCLHYIRITHHLSKQKKNWSIWDVFWFIKHSLFSVLHVKWSLLCFHGHKQLTYCLSHKWNVSEKNYDRLFPRGRGARSWGSNKTEGSVLSNTVPQCLRAWWVWRCLPGFSHFLAITRRIYSDEIGLRLSQQINSVDEFYNQIQQGKSILAT